LNRGRVGSPIHLEVSIIGANITPSISGIKPGDRTADRAQRLRRGPDGRVRQDDVADVLGADAVRGLEGNDQEEAHEDRQTHQQYAPGGFVRNKAQQRSLDIQG
jgi:hypothetical protein